MSSAATKRLLRDYRSVLADPLSTVSARPLEDDIFEWHCNMRVQHGPYSGVTFHFILRFPKDYPVCPPAVEMCTYLKHPNVFEGWRGRAPYICLDLLRPMNTTVSGGYNGGWSTAYSAQSVLLQLQSFLFEENSIPQEDLDGKGTNIWGSFYSSKLGKQHNMKLERAKEEAASFHCRKCGHCSSAAFPPLCTPSRAVGLVRNVAVDVGPSWKLSEDGWMSRQEEGRLVRRKEVNGALRIELIAQGNSTTDSSGETARTARMIARLTADVDPLACAIVAPFDVPKGKKSCGETMVISSSGDAGSDSNEIVKPEQTTKKRKTKKRNRKKTIACSAPAEGQEAWGLVRGDRVVLPDELVLYILEMLDTKAVIHLQQTCRATAVLVTRSHALVRRELFCFHTKATFAESVLGVGVSVTEGRDGRAASRSIEAPLDMLSHEAFDGGVRSSAWKETFQHYLPLMLDTQHQCAVGKRLERAIVNIAVRGSRGGSCYEAFQPSMCLDVLPKLMNSAVVRLMKADTGGRMQQHASDAALQAYCAYHHILLVCAQRYPQITQIAEDRVQRFIAAASTPRRSDLKVVCPNLGELLVLLTVSSSSWADLAPAFMVEAMARNVRWTLQDYPELYYLEDFDSSYRVRSTLNATRTSQRLLMFQVYFLQQIGRPRNEPWGSVLQRYNASFGRPPPQVARALFSTCHAILAVTSSSAFFQRLGVAAPTQLCEVMRAAVRNSAWAGYHRERWHSSQFETWEALVVARTEPQLWEVSSIGADKGAERRWIRAMQSQMGRAQQSLGGGRQEGSVVRQGEGEAKRSTVGKGVRVGVRKPKPSPKDVFSHNVFMALEEEDKEVVLFQ